MVNIKVNNGTPVSGTSLCYSCDWSLVMKGFRDSDEIVYCLRPYPDIRIPFPVRECSGYFDKNAASKEDMEKMAWILLSKRIERKVGFVKAEEFRRIYGEDEKITP